MGNVAGRPLGIQFTEEAPLVAQNSTFSVTATIWDDALDQAAEPSVLAAHSWDCAIALVNGTLNGTTEIVVGSGDNMVTFDDLMVEEAGLSYDLEVTCTSSDGSIYLTAMSQPLPCPRLPRGWHAQGDRRQVHLQGTSEEG